MTEPTPCLLRVGNNVKKYKVLKLDKDKITIGRSGEVTYAILSSMISRCHAIVKRREDGMWTIIDNKSLNGVFVNGRQLTPLVPCTLQDGDMLQFGVSTVPDMPPEFVYKFYSSLKVRIVKERKKLKTDSSVGEDIVTISASESSEFDDDREKKRKIAGERVADVTAVDGSSNKSLREQVQISQQEQASREAEYQARLLEMERLLQEKEKEQKEVQHQLEKERLEKENQAKEVEELKKKEAAIVTEMQYKQDLLEKEKEDLRLKMQAELEANLKKRESVLMAQLAAQKEALVSEKTEVEKNLQKEKDKALEEKNKELEQQLKQQKEQLEKVLEKKEVEQKLLESQLNATKEESELAKLQTLKAREDILSNFVDLMEMELQCAICNELFIKATSLNCSHSFCKLCINQWMKVKKECPNCRTPITSQMHAISLDSYIDKMVEQLSEELQQHRKKLVSQRKVDQDVFDGVVAGPSTVRAPVVTTTVRGRGARVRGGRATRAPRGRRRGAQAPQPLIIRPVTSAATPVSLQVTITPVSVQVTTAPASVPATASTTTTQVTATPVTTTAIASTSAENANTSVIELSDDDSDDSNNSNDSLDNYLRRRRWSSDESGSEEGDPDAYYGGYGRCYTCGRRGHWANGCPNL